MNRRRAFALALLLSTPAAPMYAQRSGYPPEEFGARREKLCKAMGGDGTLLLFAASMPPAGIRFRQDNDFFYLTGSEDMSAALVLTAQPCQAHLFAPLQGDAEIRVEGGNALKKPDYAKANGFTSLSPLPMLEEFLARRRRGGTQPLYVRLSERDEVDMARRDTALHLARRQNTSFGGQPSEDAYRVTTLRERYPFYELRDATPLIDALRVIKSPREIEVLRRNGRASAEGVRRAIEITRAGRYEYELEAEAAYAFWKNGAEGNAYPAIVGSGPNVNIWHYQRNDRQMKDGELIVMDYGASFGYLTMDITRTWPVSGKFDELQLRAYRCALETQKAIIGAMRPGATRAETREISRAIYKKWGFEDQAPASAGHFVGMAVHDVGVGDAPFAPGMVIAVEPIIEIKDKQLHVRIEDTVLITDGDAEILSVGVPKEVDELLAIVGKANAARAR